MIKDGHYQTFGDTVEKLLETISVYNECQLRHQALIDYIDGMGK